MNSKAEPIDDAVARDLALAALREITPDVTIGDLATSAVDDEGVLSLQFRNRMDGYPGWLWTVSLAQVPDSAPTVLEVELLPGDDALVAPDWVPWADRLAEYNAAQAALAAGGEDDSDDEDEDDEDLDDVDDLDAADFDDDGSPILHSGDVDGVDIDQFADVDDDDSEDDDSDVDEDDEDDDPDDSDSDEDDSEV